MRITFFGTRGSLACPGPLHVRYGGNTACVLIESDAGDRLVLDAGTGLRALGEALPPHVERIDILLSHLHMDHITGLGFFRPMNDPRSQVHVWGPGDQRSLHHRLSLYLSPPLFPVVLRDLLEHANVVVHDLEPGPVQVGAFAVIAEPVLHQGTTMGYRIEADGASVVFLPDHEPALGNDDFDRDPMWVSGLTLAADCDVLIHDAQYTDAEYPEKLGWGHSTIDHAVRFATLVGTRCLVLFHHDPAHDDDELDRLFAPLVAQDLPFEVIAARERMTITVPVTAGPRGGSDG